MSVIVYRGKYPHRIESVWSQRNEAGVRELCVRTNCGKVYSVRPTADNRSMPNVGDDVHTLNSTFLFQSDKRRAAK